MISHIAVRDIDYGVMAVSGMRLTSTALCCINALTFNTRDAALSTIAIGESLIQSKRCHR